MRKTIRKSRAASVATIETLTLASLAGNAILRDLKGADASSVVDEGELVVMPARHAIYRAGMPIDEVLFPIDCVLSVVTRMESGEEIEVGTVGREGMSGIPLLMGGTTTENDCYSQVPGKAIKIPTRLFRRLEANNRAFSGLLDHYLQAYVNFLGQLTGCNRLHSVYERCARWLLLSRDRVGSDNIALTHEYLAMMLGSRRSGVTIALSTLQKAGYISYVHGSITIVDRAGLEETSCECYRVARRQFAGFFDPLDDVQPAA